MQKDFFQVLSVREFVERLAAFPPTGPEQTPVFAPPGGIPPDIDGRVLAQDVIAPENLPPFNRAAMDGYAVIAADAFGATENNPAYLESRGDISIAHPPNFALEPGCCAGIVTGAPMPANADAVVMVEYTAPLGPGTVEIRRPVAPGQYVMLAGEDAQAGKIALAAGTRLRPQEIGLLAALGIPAVSVHTRPRVALISTGDELIEPSQTPKAGQIRDVNSHTLAALLRRAGAEPILAGLVPDDLDALVNTLQHALTQADTVMLSGGSSMGARDLTVEAISRLPGAEILAHGVALSPGKPTILARVPAADNGRTINKAVWGLPGQVTSAQVVLFVLGMPFVRHLAGRRDAFERKRLPVRPATLERNIASQQGREDWVRVRLHERGNTYFAQPLQGLSGLLHTLIDADGFIRIPADTEGLREGTEVVVYLV